MGIYIYIYNLADCVAMSCISESIASLFETIRQPQNDLFFWLKHRGLVIHSLFAPQSTLAMDQGKSMYVFAVRVKVKCIISKVS